MTSPSDDTSTEAREAGAPTTSPKRRDPALLWAVKATAVAAVVLAVAAGVAVDPWWAVGTLIGGLLATANLVLFIRIVESYLVLKAKAAPWALLWALKLLGLFLCVYVILRQGSVEALAFVIGYGALPIGIAASSLHTRAEPSPPEPAP